MTGQILLVKYHCLHSSCQVNCKNGELAMEEELFNELSASYEDKGVFKSPRGVCRMGFSQPFKVVSLGEMTENDEVSSETKTEAAKKTDGPVDILKEEHKTVLRNLDLIEEQIRRRDIDGLWISTSDVENEISLHSILKEEDVLFPLIADMPLSEGFIAIMKEDHRELLSLLDTFRHGVSEGDILDGIAYSVIANLRNHIKKEDSEFFEMVNRYLDKEGKKRLLEGMETADKSYKPIDPGERCAGAHAEDEILAERRRRIDEAELSIRDQLSNQCGSCH